jgi:hypothetical protein
MRMQIIPPAALRDDIQRNIEQREERDRRRLERELLHTRADSAQRCPDCNGTKYDGTYCTLCGYEPPASSTRSTSETRSTTSTCPNCGTRAHRAGVACRRCNWRDEQALRSCTPLAIEHSNPAGTRVLSVR